MDHMTESVSDLEPKIWDLMQKRKKNLKEIGELEIFKQMVKK